MSAQPSRSDDADIADRNYNSSSSNARTAANSLHPNLATSHEAQTSANLTDNQLDVEAVEAESRLRRRSATSSGSARRASRLSFNYSQGRAQPHHHHHYHHQVPPPQNNFKPFTRESLEAIKRRISEENARKLQIQAQHEVSCRDGSEARALTFVFHFATERSIGLHIGAPA